VSDYTASVGTEDVKSQLKRANFRYENITYSLIKFD